MRIFGMLAGLACLTGAASAAPVTVQMTMSDATGVVGGGSFTYDDAALLDMTGYESCDASCDGLMFYAVSGGFTVNGASFSFMENQFIDATLAPFQYDPVPSFVHPTGGHFNFGWEWAGGAFAQQFTTTGGSYIFTGNGEAFGSISYEVLETPLPAALWLFLAGSGVICSASGRSSLWTATKSR